MKQLLEAGVHFGHQTKRWNPKMKPYIFGERNGIYIIDLQKTLRLFRAALEFVTGLASQGKTVLFVGTKRQAQEAIADEARRCNMFYVNQRWLGGLLTNFSTIQRSIQRLRDLEGMKANGQYDLLSKKEVSRLERERKKLEKYLVGIKEMPSLPDALFIIDAMKESIAIREANRLGIPVVGIVDTNCDPEKIDYIIPGNDDALKSVRLITSSVAQAVITGRHLAVAAAETSEEQAAIEAAGAPAEAITGTGAAEAAPAMSSPPSSEHRPARPAAPGGPRPRQDRGPRPDRRARPQPARPEGPGGHRFDPAKGRGAAVGGGPAPGQPAGAQRPRPPRPERAPHKEAPVKTTKPATLTSAAATPVIETTDAVVVPVAQPVVSTSTSETPFLGFVPETPATMAAPATDAPVTETLAAPEEPAAAQAPAALPETENPAGGSAPLDPNVA
ncbi:MAG: 30S ribosomal protein S2 [Acidobacteria bacterium]|nr:30S ribosomal protein S2 [Acidobacteriota bacterium]MBI3655553.1 30S ribosomal protein S2 [Acidobacteriota bacterium]